MVMNIKSQELHKNWPWLTLFSWSWAGLHFWTFNSVCLHFSTSQFSITRCVSRSTDLTADMMNCVLMVITFELISFSSLFNSLGNTRPFAHSFVAWHGERDVKSKLHRDVVEDYELARVLFHSIFLSLPCLPGRPSRCVIVCLKIYLLPHYAKYVKSFKRTSELNGRKRAAIIQSASTKKYFLLLLNWFNFLIFYLNIPEIIEPIEAH